MQLPRSLSALALLCSLSLTLPAQDKNPVLVPSPKRSPWSLRLGVTYLQTVDGSTNRNVPVKVSDKFMPEIDVAYHFTPAWSAELVLTIPQRHTVSSGGVGLGSFRHLPPSLLLKYTFNAEGAFRPYLGGGLNATLIWSTDLAGGALTLDRWSFGPVGQAGFDFRLTDRLCLNADVKRMMIRTDVKSGGVKVTEARLDPWLYTIGLRYRF